MLTIVVIEEDIAMRTLFCEWLEAAGYRVRGRSEREAAAQPGTALVVVDLPNLPSQGAQLVGQVRDSYPAALLIGSSTQLSRTLAADAPQARALGLHGLVAKPCGRDELIGLVVSAIGTAH